jgi:hypothetical protein
VELYLHSPIRLHGIVLSLRKAQGQLYLCLYSGHSHLELTVSSNVFHQGHYTALCMPIRFNIHVPHWILFHGIVDGYAWLKLDGCIGINEQSFHTFVALWRLLECPVLSWPRQLLPKYPWLTITYHSCMNFIEVYMKL